MNDDESESPVLKIVVIGRNHIMKEKVGSENLTLSLDMLITNFTSAPTPPLGSNSSPSKWRSRELSTVCRSGIQQARKDFGPSIAHSIEMHWELY